MNNAVRKRKNVSQKAQLISVFVYFLCLGASNLGRIRLPSYPCSHCQGWRAIAGPATGGREPRRGSLNAILGSSGGMVCGCFRWWQLKYFLFSPRNVGKISNLPNFNWVETTNYFCFGGGLAIFDMLFFRCAARKNPIMKTNPAYNYNTTHLSLSFFFGWKWLVLILRPPHFSHGVQYCNPMAAKESTNQMDTLDVCPAGSHGFLDGSGKKFKHMTKV